MKINTLTIFLAIVFITFIHPVSASATAIYCLYDSINNEFIIVADSKQRGYSADTGETIKYRAMPKWRLLRNGALFVAAGKYVNDAVKNKSIFDLSEDAVSADMSFREAAETICNINIKYGILKLRNDENTLFEANLLGFVERVPKMIFFRFPPESQITDKPLPYYIKDRLADSRYSQLNVLGEQNAILSAKNNIFNNSNIKDYLVSVMIKQIEEEPEKVGKPIDIIIIKENNNIKHNKLE